MGEEADSPSSAPWSSCKDVSSLKVITIILTPPTSGSSRYVPPGKLTSLVHVNCNWAKELWNRLSCNGKHPWWREFKTEKVLHQKSLILTMLQLITISFLRKSSFYQNPQKTVSKLMKMSSPSTSPISDHLTRNDNSIDEVRLCFSLLEPFLVGNMGVLLVPSHHKLACTWFCFKRKS